MIILCDVGFETDLLVNIIKQMVTNIKESNEVKLVLDEGNISFDNTNLKADYEMTIKPIRILIDEKNKSTKQNFINDLLSDEDSWGSKIYEYVKENRHEIATDNITFISEMDANKVISMNKKSNNRNIYDFRKALYEAYKAMGNRVNDRDIATIKQLYDGLKSDTTQGYDLIKVRNMVTLIQFLGVLLQNDAK